MISMETIQNSGGFEQIDLLFADFINHQAKDCGGMDLYLAAALASCSVRSGHSCCDLHQIGGQYFPSPEAEERFLLPDAETMIQAVRRTAEIPYGPAACPPDMAADSHPLILEPDGLLYLNRYYRYELRIARELLHRCAVPPTLPHWPAGGLAALSARFQQGAVKPLEPDYQQAAVFLAKARHFSLITGGPGTGKTTVLTVLLAWELQENPSMRIHLCAPTGKAQARMKESILAECENLHCEETIKQKLRDLPCCTISSLLKPVRFSPNYQRNAESMLSADFVVVDEVSMASLSLLAHLFEALPQECKVLLIGDKDQLSPVEAGSVLADLIQSGTINVMPSALCRNFEQMTGWHFPEQTDHLPLSGHIAELKINYRSRFAPEISSLAAEMRQLGQDSVSDPVQLGKKILVHTATPDFSVEILQNQKNWDKKICSFIYEPTLSLEAYPGQYFAPGQIVDLAKQGTLDLLPLAFALLDSFKILCAVRQGAMGTEHINAMLSDELKLSHTDAPGTPIMILENTPSMNLYNGDIGLIWRSSDSGETRACFRDGKSAFRTFPVSQLPAHETVFAMTIHKSQGSGFRRIMIILPPKPMPLITRELVYTALTRAERSAVLCTGPEVLFHALQTKTIRYSGLHRRITEGVVSL